jgi:hypothetical protein
LETYRLKRFSIICFTIAFSFFENLVSFIFLSGGRQPGLFRLLVLK